MRIRSAAKQRAKKRFRVCVAGWGRGVGGEGKVGVGMAVGDGGVTWGCRCGWGVKNHVFQSEIVPTA